MTRGRDPLLVLYTQTEPILTDTERTRLLAKWRTKRDIMTDDARSWWDAQARTDPDRRSDRVGLGRPPCGDTEQICAAFRRWRRSETPTRVDSFDPPAHLLGRWMPAGPPYHLIGIILP